MLQTLPYDIIMRIIDFDDTPEMRHPYYQRNWVCNKSESFVSLSTSCRHLRDTLVSHLFESISFMPPIEMSQKDAIKAERALVCHPNLVEHVR